MVDAGNEGRALFLDNVEAALGKPQRRGGMFFNNTVEDVIRRQLRQAEKVRKQIDKTMRRCIDENANWTPDFDLVAAIAKNTDAVAKAVGVLRSLRKDAKDARRGLSPDQLDEVFRFNLRRIAGSLDEKYWRELIGIKFGADVADVLLRAPLPPRGDSSTVATATDEDGEEDA